MQSNQTPSASIKIKPQDDRCKYWCKIIRYGVALPMPSECTSANQVPGVYHRRGDEELFPGDVVIEGEENHHRHNRGWSYSIGTIDKDGEKKGRLYCRDRETSLLWSGSDISHFLESYWFADKL